MRTKAVRLRMAILHSERDENVDFERWLGGFVHILRRWTDSIHRRFWSSAISPVSRQKEDTSLDKILFHARVILEDQSPVKTSWVKLAKALHRLQHPQRRRSVGAGAIAGKERSKRQ